MALKFLTLYGEVSEGGLREQVGAWATWFHHPPALHPFDAKMYPDRTRIVYWNANHPAMARASADFPAGSLVKVSTEPCLTEAHSRWPAVNAFRWFSCDRWLPQGSVPVEAFGQVDDELLDLSSVNGYSRQALVDQESRGCRWFLARVGKVPEAICFVQPNFGSIWEVSGVLVRPQARGRGLAKAVVTAAVNHLVGRGLTPRYFVHDQNFASLGVARSLGLVERGQTTHFALPRFLDGTSPTS